MKLNFLKINLFKWCGWWEFVMFIYASDIDWFQFMLKYVFSCNLRLLTSWNLSFPSNEQLYSDFLFISNFLANRKKGKNKRKITAKVYGWNISFLFYFLLIFPWMQIHKVEKIMRITLFLWYSKHNEKCRL